MLTFKNAPKTVLGPCEHALWNGTVFVSKHHQHMAGTVDEWKATIADLTKDPTTAAAIDQMASANKKLSQKMFWSDKDAHRQTLALWSDALKVLEDAIAKH